MLFTEFLFYKVHREISRWILKLSLDVDCDYPNHDHKLFDIKYLPSVDSPSEKDSQRVRDLLLLRLRVDLLLGDDDPAMVCLPPPPDACD